MTNGEIDPFADVIEAGVPVNRDNCPVLTRINAFLVQENTCPTLQHTMRLRSGQSADLVLPLSDSVPSSTSNVSDSSTSSESTSASPEIVSPDQVFLYVRELSAGLSPVDIAPVRIAGYIHDAVSGAVRAELPITVTGQAGIYQASWGFVRNDKLRLVNNAVISVERNLFGTGNTLTSHTLGPPTIQEIRTQLWDSGPGDNLLLDDVEFSDDQIIDAILWPIRDFNDAVPPLNFRFTTFNFPYRQQWITGIMHRLHLYAANYYRRNKLPGSAGGISMEDLNRDREYMQAATQFRQEWEYWRDATKSSLNASMCYGSLDSDY